MEMGSTEVNHLLDAPLDIGIGLIRTFVMPYALKAAVNLGLPRVLAKYVGQETKLSAEEIANMITTPTGAPANARNLERILRILASEGLVKESFREKTEGGKGAPVEREYEVLPAMTFFDDSQQVCFAYSVLTILDDVFNAPRQYLHMPVLDSSLDGYVLAYGKKAFEFIASNERFNNLFNRAMSELSAIFMPQLLAEYDGFRSLKTLVDVGGGLGTSLVAILSKYPHIRGINFDQPHVVRDAPQYPGIEHVGGNFFESVPEGGDAVFMKFILHDWNDDSCVKILKNIYKALPPHGKLINSDIILPELVESVSVEDSIKFSYDLSMMTLNPGAHDRTLSQFRVIALEAGFAHVEVVANFDSYSVMEFYKQQND